MSKKLVSGHQSNLKVLHVFIFLIMLITVKNGCLTILVRIISHEDNFYFAIHQDIIQSSIRKISPEKIFPSKVGRQSHFPRYLQ